MPILRFPAEIDLPGRFGALMLTCAVIFFAGCVNPIEERWRIYNDIGVQDFAQGNYRGALDSFDLAMTFRPQDPVLVYNAGQCYERLGDFKNAEASYTHCLLIDSKHTDAHHALIALLYRTDRKQQASERIQEWFQREPNSADPYVADAWRLRQEKNYPDAQGRLQQAMGIDPHHVRALTELGIVYQQMGMPDRARVVYEHVLERDKSQTEIAERLEQLKAKGVRRPIPE